MLRVVLLVLFMFSLPGCYYLQAAKGQLDLNRKREPIDDILKDEDTPPELAARLRLVQEARQFSIDVLGLPDNDSYRTTRISSGTTSCGTSLPRLSFRCSPRPGVFRSPAAWPIAATSRKKPRNAKRSNSLRDGFDVAVGGVAAYSTLGKLSDPIISSMMHWDDVQLVAVLFHELAHQVLYVKGDSGFNESFATAVEEIGVRLWLDAKGLTPEINRYESSRQLRQDLMALIDVLAPSWRVLMLMTFLMTTSGASRMRGCSPCPRVSLRCSRVAGREPGRWLVDDLNNARLASDRFVRRPAARVSRLYERCEQRIECFYDEARALAGR